MQIVIPMSGVGQRFINAGYEVPKPLIEIDGKPIIEHVVNMFPGETNIIFICNDVHLRETNMKEILKKIAPTSKIIEVAREKKGPVYAVSQIYDLISDDEEVIVNYCDFGCYWDYEDFLKHTRNRNADGAVPAYKGFHPHMLGTTNYAFMRDENQWMLQIKEKEPFTNNRMQEYASSGTYYFKKGSYVKKYFQQLMDRNINLNGEYYVSLVYNLMKEDNLKISIYEIQHMLQWGTPEDVEEYLPWSNYFKLILNEDKKEVKQKNSINLIPLAGKGIRFFQEGYKDPKPLILVSGKPMIIQATNYLPKSEEFVFVCLQEHLEKYPNLEKEIKKTYENAIIRVDENPKGQASSCEVGISEVDLEAPLLIAACDNGMIWNKENYEELLANEEIDAIVWTFRNHISAKLNPQMYGWVKTDVNNYVEYVSVKKQISENPYQDHAIVGTFYYRKAKYFIDALERMYAKEIKVNGEYYADSTVNELVEMGLRVKVFEVDSYICWGTPNDLRTFEYWQSFFHKCEWHPYDLKKDKTVSDEYINELDEKYRHFKQEYV